MPRDGKRPEAILRKLRDSLALLCLAALVGYVLFAPLTTGQLIIGHDMDEHFHAEAFNRQAFAQGQIPLWNPYVFSGFPAQADIQTLVFYPPAWLLRLLPLELGAFFMWSLAAHLWLLGAGTYAVCRQVGVSRPASLAAASGLMLGGIAMPRVFAGHLVLIYGFSWMPLITALTLRSMESGRLLPHWQLVLALLVQFLAGASQPSVYTLAIVALIAVMQSAWPALPLTRRFDRLRPLGQLTVLAGLFVGLTAFQALPLLRLTLESGRGGGISYEQATKGSFFLSHLWTIAFPNALADFGTQFQDGLSGGLWEKSAYVGFLLAVAAPLSLYSPLRRPVLLFWFMALGGLAFALGENSPAYSLHYALLPGFRIPSRLLSVVALAVAVLGAIGLDVLARPATGSRWVCISRTVYVIAVAGGVVAMVIMQPSVQAGADSAPRALLSGSDSRWIIAQGLGLFAVLAVGWLTRRSTPALLLALALISVDVTRFAGQFLIISGPGANPEAQQAFAGLPIGRALSLCQSTITSNAMMSLRIPTVDGYNSAFLRRYADYASLVRGEMVGRQYPAFPKIGRDGLPRHMNLLNGLNVTHIHTCSELDAPYLLVHDGPTGQVYENPAALPRVFLVCQVERVTSDQLAGQVMADIRFDPLAQVVIVGTDRDLAGLRPLRRPCSETTEAYIQTRDTTSGDLVVDVDAPQAGILVIAETLYPEREAWVDGQSTPLVRANLALSGLVLSPGPHRVVLRYVPNSLYLGTAISATTALAWIVVLLIARRHASRRGRAARNIRQFSP